MRGRSGRTPEKRAAFLAALTEGFSVHHACVTAGISRRAAYDWRDDVAEFRAAWDAAVEEGTDTLEDEARRRAFHGVDEPVFYKGATCGVVRKYSDVLIMFLLNGRRPEKFNRTRVEHSGTDGGPVRCVIETALSRDPSAADPTPGHSAAASTGKR